MGNIKAIPTKDGLVVAFNKHELAHIKGGGMSNLTLVTGGQRVKMTFMRDTTFKKEKRRLLVIEETAQEQAKELKADIEGIANDLIE